MPKTRRIGKVGGKRRKSMKGGNLQAVLQNAQNSIKGVADNAELDKHRKELTAHVAALQAESKAQLSKGKAAFSSGLSSVSNLSQRAQNESKAQLSKGKAAFSSGMLSLESKGQQDVSSRMSLFNKPTARAGSRKKRHHQRGGDTTPQEARQIAEDHDAVNAVREELKLNINTVDELMTKINAPGEHTDEKNQDIGKLDAALVSKVEIHEKLAGLIDKITKEEMSSKYLKDNIAHHAGEAIKSAQSNAADAISGVQKQITEQVNERAGTVVSEAQKAQEASKGLLGIIASAVGLRKNDTSQETVPIAGGRRRKRKGHKTKKNHLKKGKRSKTHKDKKRLHASRKRR